MITPSQAALVSSSWQMVTPIWDQAADLFYDRLFEIAPQVKPMFPDDMRQQKRKLMAMLAMAVGGLPDVGALTEPLKDLGAKHAGYGTQESHYEAVGSALLWTLGKGLEPAFTPEVEAAWIEAYGILAELMKAGAREAQATLAPSH